MKRLLRNFKGCAVISSGIVTGAASLRFDPDQKSAGFSLLTTIKRLLLKTCKYKHMKSLKTVQKWSGIGEFNGAFADGAVLFPLMAALALQTGMDAARLLGTAGIAYLVAGLLFRVPMPVQPLKSVVVTAIAVGASAADVAWSGFTVGLLCFLLAFCNPDKYSTLVPRHIVHGLQIGLGILLVTKGLQGGLSGVVVQGQATFVLLSGAIIIISLLSDKPLIGWLATSGLLAGFWMTLKSPAVEHVSPNDAVHIGTVVSLVVPQMALTLTNSVVGTYDASIRYFGKVAANRVKPSMLLLSIGIGNILSAHASGLPFCHGAGGLTAHVKGGARTWRMNIIIGTTLLALAFISVVFDASLIPSYPKILMSAMLLGIGYFHILLAKESWAQPDLRWIIAGMALVAVYSQDMLWVLAAGVFGELGRLFLERIKKGRKRI